MTLCPPVCMPCGRSCSDEPKVFLQPGDWHFGESDTCVRTTLGSCVSFTLWHSRLRIGGICHYMLAHRAGGEALALDGRYADEALELLHQAAREHGTHLRDYDVKLFGGADMFHLPNRVLSSVASCNIEAARALVSRYGLTVAAESLGGSSYRQILFSIGSGDVWVRKGPAAPSPGPIIATTRGAA